MRVDRDRTWIGEEGIHHCPQIPIVALADDPYFNFDFTNKLDQDTTISSVATPTEIDSKTVTISDESVSNDGKVVSFKATGMTPAGNFTIRATATLSSGTTQAISLQGTFKAV